MQWYDAEVTEIVSPGHHLLPHEAAWRAIPADPDSLIVVRPGMSIALDLASGGIPHDRRQPILEHFTAEFEQHGVAIVPVGQGDLTLQPSLELGRTHSADYETVPGTGNDPPERVTARESILRLRLFDARGVVWERVRTSGGFLPPVVVTREGESLQESFGGLQIDWTYYQMKVPRHIIRHPPGGAFGHSQIRNGRLVHSR